MTDQNYRTLEPWELKKPGDEWAIMGDEDWTPIPPNGFLFPPSTKVFKFRRPIPPVAKSATVPKPFCAIAGLHGSRDSMSGGQCNCMHCERECDCLEAPTAPVKESLTTEETNWPNCKEAQCAQVHDYLDSLLASLGVDCPKHYYSVAKAIHVSEALKKVELAFTAMKLRAEKAESFKGEASSALTLANEVLAEYRGKLQTAERERDEAKIKWRELEDKIGYLPDGTHPDEREPRSTTWLQERANWQKERDAIRAEFEKIKKDRCEECGTKLYFGPPCCPRCGAPNCCPLCCMVAATESLRAENARLREALEKMKVKNLVNAVARICPDCGHSASEDGCAFCLKTAMAPLFKMLHEKIGDKDTGYWGSIKIESELISTFESAQAALAGKGEKCQ